MSEYTREEILKLIEHNGGPEGLDLARKDLSDIDLGYRAIQAQLEKARQRTTDETPVWLSEETRGIDLQGADLTGANLQEAKLWDANLQGAYLARTNLQGAILWYAKLQGAYLGRANLQGAKLNRVQYNYDTTWPRWPKRFNPPPDAVIAPR